jgi:hypothetical protein
MEQIRDYSDERLHGKCVFCGGPDETADHVPSRVFLDKPYPENLPCVPACHKCNSGFSLDEEYLACLIGCVKAGSADPKAMHRPKVARTLEQKPDLASRILSGRTEGPSGPIFTPEADRVRNVIVKLARGHAAFEFAATALKEPLHCAIVPLDILTEAQRNAFEKVPTSEIWPEVGSRAMSRLLITSEGQLFTEDWIEVQPERYRYAAIPDGGIFIRLVIDEYLAAEVRWTD